MMERTPNPNKTPTIKEQVIRILEFSRKEREGLEQEITIEPEQMDTPEGARKAVRSVLAGLRSSEQVNMLSSMRRAGAHDLVGRIMEIVREDEDRLQNPGNFTR